MNKITLTIEENELLRDGDELRDPVWFEEIVEGVWEQNARIGVWSWGEAAQPRRDITSEQFAAYNRHYNNKVYRAFTGYLYHDCGWSDMKAAEAGNLLQDIAFQRLGSVGFDNAMSVLSDYLNQNLLSSQRETAYELRDAFWALFPDLRDAAAQVASLTDKQRFILEKMPLSRTVPFWIGDTGTWQPIAETLCSKGLISAHSAEYGFNYYLTDFGVRVARILDDQRFAAKYQKVA